MRGFNSRARSFQFMRSIDFTIDELLRIAWASVSMRQRTPLSRWLRRCVLHTTAPVRLADWMFSLARHSIVDTPAPSNTPCSFSLRRFALLFHHSSSHGTPWAHRHGAYWPCNITAMLQQPWRKAVFSFDFGAAASSFISLVRHGHWLLKRFGVTLMRRISVPSWDFCCMILAPSSTIAHSRSWDAATMYWAIYLAANNCFHMYV